NRRSTRPGCEGGPAGDVDLCLPGSHRGRCSYNRTTTQPRTVGAPAPGAKGGAAWGVDLCLPVRTEAVPLQQNLTQPRPVGPPAPGAKGDLQGMWFVPDPFAPRAVLLQQNQSHLRTVGAPAPGAKGCCRVQRRLSGSLWGCWTASARRRRTWLRG